MRLRNKKTGQVGNFIINEDHFECTDLEFVPEYKTIADINEEWEDYEESKEYWCITGRGNLHYLQDITDENDKDHREIGNYFETEEEAEKAVEKLKAWKRLKDLGTEILGWEIRDMPTGGDWQTVNVKLNIKARKEPMELLDLLFWR